MAKHVRAVLIAGAMIAGGVALPASAQTVAAVTQVSVVSQAQDQEWGEDDYIVVGAIADRKAPKPVVDAEDAKLPEMPVVYEQPAVATKPKEPVTGF